MSLSRFYLLGVRQPFVHLGCSPLSHVWLFISLGVPRDPLVKCRIRDLEIPGTGRLGAPDLSYAGHHRLIDQGVLLNFIRYMSCLRDMTELLWKTS